MNPDVRLFAYIACAALVGVSLLALIVIAKFWPRRENATATLECGHRIKAEDPWNLVLAHQEHLTQCPGKRVL
jgi:hypothetical protein